MENPSRFEGVEVANDWREQREQAPAQAADFIKGIPDFENMDPVTQCAMLEAHIDTLVDNSKSRYLRKEIMRNVHIIRAKADYDNRMRALAA